MRSTLIPLFAVIASTLFFGFATSDFTLKPSQGNNLTRIGTEGSGSVYIASNYVPYAAAAVWAKDPISLVKNKGAFSSTFNFEVSGQADGFAFVLQNQGILVGDAESNCGYNIFNRSVAVRFDIFPNGVDGEPSDKQYVAIEFNGERHYNKAAASAFYVLSGARKSCTISYDGTALKVAISGKQILKKALVLGQRIDLSSVYVGFTGATGGLRADIVIGNWSLTKSGSKNVLLDATVRDTKVAILNQQNDDHCGYYSDDLLFLCDGKPDAAWITPKQKLLSGFVSEITYQMFVGSGYYAHSFAFVVQNQGLVAGGGLAGADGFKKSIAVVVNKSSQDNYTTVSIQANGNSSNILASGGFAVDYYVAYTLKIVYDAQHRLSVFNNNVLQATVVVDIAATIGVARTVPVWAGLTVGKDSNAGELEFFAFNLTNAQA